MNRRRFLQAAAAALSFLSTMWSWVLAPTRAAGAARSISRVRPGDPAWPSVATWEELNREVGGRLIKVQSPLAACQNAPTSEACREVFRKLKNPLLHRRRSRPDPSPRLGRRMDVAAKCLRCRRPDDRRCRGGRQFRPREQSATRRKGWRPQLPGYIQCGGLVADLDTRDEFRHLARRVHRCRV